MLPAKQGQILSEILREILRHQKDHRMDQRNLAKTRQSVSLGPDGTTVSTVGIAAAGATPWASTTTEWRRAQIIREPVPVPADWLAGWLRIYRPLDEAPTDYVEVLAALDEVDEDGRQLPRVFSWCPTGRHYEARR